MLEVLYQLEVMKEAKMAEVTDLQMHRLDAIQNDDRSHYDLSNLITKIEKEIVELEMKILDDQIELAKEEMIAYEHQTCRKLRELKFESSELFEARKIARAEMQKKMGKAAVSMESWKIESDKRKAQEKDERDAATAFATDMECRLKNGMVLRKMREERDETNKEIKKLKTEKMLLDTQVRSAEKKLKEFEKMAPMGIENLLEESQKSLKEAEKMLEHMEQGIRGFHAREAAAESRWEKKIQEADSEIDMLQKAILEKCKMC